MTDRPDDRTQPISTEATSEQPSVDAAQADVDAAQPVAADVPAWANAAHEGDGTASARPVPVAAMAPTAAYGPAVPAVRPAGRPGQAVVALAGQRWPWSGRRCPRRRAGARCGRWRGRQLRGHPHRRRRPHRRRQQRLRPRRYRSVRPRRRRRLRPRWARWPASRRPAARRPAARRPAAWGRLAAGRRRPGPAARRRYRNRRERHLAGHLTDRACPPGPLSGEGVRSHTRWMTDTTGRGHRRVGSATRRSESAETRRPSGSRCCSTCRRLSPR